MKSAVTLFCLLLAIPAWPQTASQSQPEVTSHADVTSHESAVTFSGKANLVSVPVVIRDAEGRAVGNLKQEGFQLFDKGKIQTITGIRRKNGIDCDRTLGRRSTEIPKSRGPK